MITAFRPGLVSRTKLAFPILLLASVVAMAAHHGGGRHHNRPTFGEFDLDGDGAIVAAEFYEARAARIAERAKAGGKMKNVANAPTFESIDLDDDGKISADEFSAHQQRMMQNRRKK